MKKRAFGFLVIIMAVGFCFGYAQDKMDHSKMKKNETNKTTEVKSTGKFVNKVCIVSHEEIDPKISAEYKGKTYAFCCNTCLKKFKKDPAKYVAKFEKENIKTDKRMD